MSNATPQLTSELAPSRIGAERLSAVILLGGGLTPSPLAAAARCSVLDLLIRPEQTVFDRWMLAVASLNGVAGENMPVIVAAGGGTPAPQLRSDHAHRRVELVINSNDFRGAAGVVHDVTSVLPDNALLLVAEAARCPEFDLATEVRHHIDGRLDASVLINADRSPAGVYLMTRDLLRNVQREGYMDLKEQWLDRVIAAGRRVGVRRIAGGCSRPLRTPDQLIEAARSVAAGGRSSDASRHFSNDARAMLQGTFQCIAPQAVVAGDAVVIDSIIMRGARVGRACVVARSIVCAGASVADGEVLVDSVRSARVSGRNGHHENGKQRGLRP